MVAVVRPSAAHMVFVKYRLHNIPRYIVIVGGHRIFVHKLSVNKLVWRRLRSRAVVHSSKRFLSIPLVIFIILYGRLEFFQMSSTSVLRFTGKQMLTMSVIKRASTRDHITDNTAAHGRSRPSRPSCTLHHPRLCLATTPFTSRRRGVSLVFLIDSTCF